MANIGNISVDRDLCIGAASCVVAAGGVFELDGENKAVLKQKGGVKHTGPAERSALEDDTATDEAILLAAQSCPTKAIIVHDVDGKQIYP